MGEHHLVGLLVLAPGGAFSPPVLSPVELPCRPCPSPLACSPCLPASSAYPLLITSHSDVTLMSPHCTPIPGPGCCPRPTPRLCSPPVHAVSCCRLILESFSPCAGSFAAFLWTATYATSGPASAQLSQLVPSLRACPRAPHWEGSSAPHQWDMVGPPVLPSNVSVWGQSTLPSQPEHPGVLLGKLAPTSTRSPLIGDETLRMWLGRKAPPSEGLP